MPCCPGAALLVAVLGLTVATVAFAPGVGANTAPIGSGTPTASDDGVLDWGLKESFRAYVEGPIADGEITMIAPATRNTDGTFRFPDGTGEVDPDAGTVSVHLAGGVSFYGHEGSLDLTIDDVRLQIAGGTGAIVVDMRSGAETYPDLEIVTLDLGGQQLDPDPDGVVTLIDVATTLTAGGSTALGEFYPPGTSMDPFTFMITVDGSDPTEPPTTSPPTTTPPTSPPPTTSTTTWRDRDTSAAAGPVRERDLGRGRGQLRPARVGRQGVVPVLHRRADRRRWLDARRHHRGRWQVPLDRVVRRVRHG